MERVVEMWRVTDRILCLKMELNSVMFSAGHPKFTLNSATANSAKLQEVFCNRKSAILR